MDFLQVLIRAMRNLRAEVKIPPQQSAPRMCLRLKNESCGAKEALVNRNADLVKLLTKVEKIELLSVETKKPPRSISTITSDWELFFPVGELLDVEKEVTRLRGEMEKLDKELARIGAKLSNANFIERAPADVVEKEREALSAAKSQKERIEDNIQGLE
jgi:valyl-tRNA synthetase